MMRPFVTNLQPFKAFLVLKSKKISQKHFISEGKDVDLFLKLKKSQKRKRNNSIFSTSNAIKQLVLLEILNVTPQLQWGPGKCHQMAHGGRGPK
jgi:hypothetical protein